MSEIPLGAGVSEDSYVVTEDGSQPATTVDNEQVVAVEDGDAVVEAPAEVEPEAEAPAEDAPDEVSAPVDPAPAEDVPAPTPAEDGPFISTPVQATDEAPAS